MLGYVAFGLPYGTAVLLGLSKGKLSECGPLIRGTWHTSFWVATILQCIALGVLAVQIWYPQNLNPWVPVSVFAVSGVSVVMAAGIALVTLLVNRKGDGLEHSPLAPEPDLSPMAGLGDTYMFDGGEAVLVIGGGMLVLAIIFSIAFFPLRGIARIVSRISYHGIIKA